MYQLGKAYTKKELAQEVLGINPNTFKTNSDLYMNHLKQYFVIQSVPNGRWEKYILTKEIKPWETYGDMKKKENKKVIEDFRDEAAIVIKETPRITKTAVAEKIQKHPKVKQYGYCDITNRKHTGEAMEKYFNKSNGCWCEKLSDGSYRECTDEEKDLFRQLRYEYNNQQKTDEWFTVLNQKMNGEINDKELSEKVDKVFGNYYNRVIGEFQKAFGFRPIWVYEWEIKDELKIGAEE